MRIVYMDEAGISNRNQESHVVVAAAIIDADRVLASLEHYLEELINEYIPEHHREGFIFHATEIFHGHKAGCGKVFDRDNYPRKKRGELADQLSIIPTK